LNELNGFEALALAADEQGRLDERAIARVVDELVDDVSTNGLKCYYESVCYQRSYPINTAADGSALQSYIGNDDSRIY
jgi:hypothetical protein